MKVTEQDKQNIRNPHRIPDQLMHYIRNPPCTRWMCGLTKASLEYLDSHPGVMEQFAEEWNAREKRNTPSKEEILVAIQELVKADACSVWVGLLDNGIVNAVTRGRSWKLIGWESEGQ